MPQVRFLPKEVEVECKSGTNLMELAADAGIELKAVCGGAGSCGKCQVIVNEGEVEILDQGNLSPDKLNQGYVLACKTEVATDVTIEIPPESRLSKHQVFIDEKAEEEDKLLTEEELELQGKFEISPIYTRMSLELEEPSLVSNAGDLERLYTELNRNRGSLPALRTPLPVLKDLAGHLRENDWQTQVSVTRVTEDYGEIVELNPIDDQQADYGIAVDIGTTTVVLELVDLEQGKVVATEGAYNRQANFGDDIIGRINFAKEKDGGLDRLHQAIIKTINELIDQAVESAGIAQDDIKTAVFAGNTTMVHLFLGIDPNNIRIDPYIPTVNFVPPLRAQELGINIKDNGWLHCLPGVSSFVGGDITSGTLATNISEQEKITLFIDIGTNGELVLGNQDWLMTCSCSAGPAFEGGGITHGMRAMAGAIEFFEIDAESYQVKYSTVNDAPPIGICGSGLINLLAILEETGIIGRSGQFDMDLDTDRLRETDYDKEFVLVWAEEAGIDEDIVISENDIKNLLRSKGAIYAGIRMMLQNMSLQEEFIEQVFIAGGFGHYINLEDALKIGLLPDLPLDRFTFVGNTSLKGARMSLLSEEKFEEVQEIANKMTYLELSAESQSQDFMDEFVAAQFIPHTDLSLFPSVTG
ncbi:ASKHA domain-containing protein [Fuchsiella alkaliacetigena]|uniref:ASKHA domain-containing protein n=1 Tax=Fuchsiella alkaliacetigena TaxID=957042 RepID=UPI00200A7BEB|nr:ASKHA domain-containing protein [Fuchsiella alkaliacetigena]MCK8823746.1 ASKHA domain-containing protein [Fuchsiella alkaliacetigena]